MEKQDKFALHMPIARFIADSHTNLPMVEKEIEEGRLVDYVEDNERLIQLDRHAQLYIHYCGNVPPQKASPKLLKYRGIQAFNVNGIIVRRKVEQIAPGQKLYFYICYLPDGTDRTFTDLNEQFARQEARTFCHAHPEFGTRSPRMYMGGHGAFLSLTFYEIKLLLAIIPRTNANIHLIRKLNKAFDKGMLDRDVPASVLKEYDALSLEILEENS